MLKSGIDIEVPKDPPKDPPKGAEPDLSGVPADAPPPETAFKAREDPTVFIEQTPTAWGSSVFRGAPARAPIPVVLLIILIGLIGTSCIDILDWGLGVTIATLAALLGVTFLHGGKPWTQWQVAGLASAGVLFLVPALRDADWLVTPSVLLGLFVVLAVLAGGRTTSGLVVVVLVPLLAIARAAGWTTRGLSRLTRKLIGESGSSAERVKSARKLAGVLVVTVILILVLGNLLVSADAVFSVRVRGVLSVFHLDFGFWLVHVIGWIFFSMLMAIACYLRYFPSKPDLFFSRFNHKIKETWPWAIPVGALNLLLLAFTISQAQSLFGGDEYVQKTAGLTYSEYARSGFWQLLGATAMLLLIIWPLHRFMNHSTTRQRVIIRIQMGLLTFFGLTLAASALVRLHLYQQAYGYTVDRFAGFVLELWLGVVFVIIFVGYMAPFSLAQRLVPRICFASAIATAIIVFLLNPVAFIAQENIDRYFATGKIDSKYLASLGADAVPTIAASELPNRECILWHLTRKDDHSWRTASLSALRAERISNELSDPGACEFGSDADGDSTR